jgi:3-hydroxyisobutyrate dehydrogenase-like beta-hydroxyacid dehydrogenase
MAPDLRKHRLGWIGLGRMGYAMAERLAKVDADVRGYNRTRAKAESLTAAGAALVDRPVDLAECDIVFTMVSTADDLREDYTTILDKLAQRAAMELKSEQANVTDGLS